MESSTGFQQDRFPQTVFPHISLSNPFPLLPTHFFVIRIEKQIEKQILVLPSWETNQDRRTRTLACYLLGH